MILYILATILALGGGTQCSDDSQTTINKPPVEKPPIALADGNATAKTKALYNNLFTITEKGTMFGQQIPTLYGLDAVA
ncbi:MAG: hypothetical protein LBE91_09285, partial [Tannerella sp.]|nr:hypothetical protein [Tannerella sp.]